MKIVILTSRFPYPLEKGDKLRVYNFVKEMSKENEITLITLNSGKISEDSSAQINKFCKKIHIFNLSKTDYGINLLRALVDGNPFQVGIFYKKSYGTLIQKIIKEEKPDAVFCHLIRMSEYIKDMNTYPKTLDYMDAFSKGIERRSCATKNFVFKKILENEHRRLVKYESDIFDKFENKIIISEQDRDFIPHIEKEKITIIPNGVDSEIFFPLERKKKFDLLFTGNMGYPPNVESAIYTVKQIFPIVQKSLPEINLLIAGINPPKELTDLNSEKIKIIPEFSHIREAFAQSKIMLAPMLISIGLQNKILQAMAMKIPVICSPLANNAIKAPVNSCILEAVTSEEYSEKINMLLNNKSFYDEMTENAYQFVLNNFNWEKVNNKLKEIIFKTYPLYIICLNISQ